MKYEGYNVLATRADPDLLESVSDLHPNLRYNALGRTILLARESPDSLDDDLAIVPAGTADLPVVEEAAETARPPRRVLLPRRTSTERSARNRESHRLGGHSLPQPFHYLHDCSDCFRLERQLPGGTCTH